MINILIQSALMSFGRLLTLPMRCIFWRIFAISLSCLIIFWLLIRHVFALYFIHFISPLIGNVSLTLGWIGVLALISLIFGISHLLYILLCPLITFIGSFFADNIIAIIEKKDFATHTLGKAMTIVESILFGLRFFFLAIFGNIIALMLYFIPPIHLLGFYLVNGYIFGRTYFMINALRFSNYSLAHQLFQDNWALVFCAGIIIAIISTIPLLGIITPVFAPIFMCYIYKNIKGARLIL